MRGRAVVVAVGLFGLDDGHKVKPSMADAALGGESIGEVADVAGTAAQYRDFQTGVVIEVDVQTGDSEVVAVVLRVGQSLREFAGFVVIHIGQGGDAGGSRRFRRVAADVIAHDVAQGFGSAGIAAPVHQGVDRAQQVAVDGDRDAFHVGLPGPLAECRGAWTTMQSRRREMGLPGGRKLIYRIRMIGNRAKQIPVARRMGVPRMGVAVGILAPLAALNVAVWLWAWVLFADRPALFGVALLAWTLGLRHAVDADHIAAIDNVVRALIRDGRQSRLVGLYFSLGHSTVVVLACVAIAATASAFDLAGFRELGGTIGVSVSALFLLTIAAMNCVLFVDLWRAFGRMRSGVAADPRTPTEAIADHGLLTKLFRPLFRLIRRSWHMYPLGFLFGLGFDTATEVGLLSIAATEGANGASPWSVLIFPALFAAGMVLVDTADSVFMTQAYGWALIDPLRKLWYNLTITATSVVVALLIGGMEALGLLAERFELQGAFWSVVADANAGLTHAGLAAIGLCALIWGVSAAVFRWKTRDMAVGGG